MTITPEVVRQWDEAYANLKLTPTRLEELPLELDQLRAAAEAARNDLLFDTDPFNFVASMLICRRGENK